MGRGGGGGGGGGVTQIPKRSVSFDVKSEEEKLGKSSNEKEVYGVNPARADTGKRVPIKFANIPLPSPTKLKWCFPTKCAHSIFGDWNYVTKSSDYCDVK